MKYIEFIAGKPCTCTTHKPIQYADSFTSRSIRNCHTQWLEALGVWLRNDPIEEYLGDNSLTYPTDTIMGLPCIRDDGAPREGIYIHYGRMPCQI